MKRLILATVGALLLGTAAWAQKYAYIDSEYILKNIPEYETAQQKLDDMSLEWQKEIEKKFEEIDKLYKAYQAESVLLPDDLKKKREEEIIQKEKEAKDLQKKRFGKDGDLFKKRQELIKPIQDKIYNAIEEIATLKSYAFVFDKSGSLTIMFADPKFDISDDVLKKIGNVKRE
jgi:outer membrane protein